MKLNPDLKEKRAGIFVMILWFAVAVFYLTWNGWVGEYLACGYSGPNQFFGFQLLKASISGNSIVYQSTNNWWNLIYICYFVLALSWIGLLTGNQTCKQGAMAGFAFPVIAAMSNLMSPGQEYVMFIVYDIVHGCGIVCCVYFFYKEEVHLKQMWLGIYGTWVLYIISRIIYTPWPYWSQDATGHVLVYVNVNQIGAMPVYFYGLEYIIVILLMYIFNSIFALVNKRIQNRKWHAIIPFFLFFIICVTFILGGLIKIVNVNPGLCP